MALQATMTLLRLTSLAATEAVLRLLFMMWWPFGIHVAPPAPAIELKPDPIDNEISTPSPETQRHVQAGPTDLDLDMDFEALHAQVRRRYDLELDALCGSTTDHQNAKVLQDLEDEWRRCDLELDALCESTMDDQSVKVFQDLDDLGGGPVVAQTATDFDANVELYCDRSLEGMRSHATDANDGALDGMCAAVLKALEDEYAGSGALDNETQGDNV